MAFDFDLGRDLWLNRSRFTVLQREYLDVGQLESFLKRCKQIGLGEAKRGVVTTMPSAQVITRPKRHRWGPCMLAWDFRGGNKYETPTLTMHSRVSYIAYIGGADLALCHVLAREIGKRIGLEPKDFQFRWYLGSSQFHFFKSLPYLLRHDLHDVLIEDSKEFPSSKHPTLKGVRRWYKDAHMKYEMGVPLEDEKYGPVKRIRRRYEEHMRGEGLPPCPVETMTFDPLYRR
jgi:hypothetical protein